MLGEHITRSVQLRAVLKVENNLGVSANIALAIFRVNM